MCQRKILLTLRLPGESGAFFIGLEGDSEQLVSPPAMFERGVPVATRERFAVSCVVAVAVDSVPSLSECPSGSECAAPR